MTAILKEDPPEIRASDSGPTPSLQRIAQHCLEKKPRERFQSARDSAGAAQMDISRTGILLTAPVDSVVGDMMLSWVDRTGRGEPLNTTRQPYDRPAISPDGARVAITIGNSIAVLDLARLTTVKLALPARAEFPVWSGDGRRLRDVRRSPRASPDFEWPAAGSQISARCESQA